ncbi:MAG: GNAT family N-acetyltransferase [Gemmatimonadaceae bacterium]|nr:GNAT family N-acetyltransferase [Gemmatimonadaceae bacterium]
MTTIVTTPRTHIRELTADDAPFIRDLLNQPSFLRFIGDRQVRTADDAAAFIETRYRQSYRKHGYGLYVVETLTTPQSMGLCGFVRRAPLPHADLGFAFLPQFEGQGYAHEAALAMLEVGRHRFGLTDVLAIVQDQNQRSRALLDRLGFHFAETRTMPGDTTPVMVFRRRLALGEVST